MAAAFGTQTSCVISEKRKEERPMREREVSTRAGYANEAGRETGSDEGARRITDEEANGRERRDEGR